jgi:hypothetical protein
MAHYTFHTNWEFAAPLETVFEEIAHPERWPSWWSNIARVELLAAGDANGVGAVRRFTFTTQLPYNLTFNLRLTRVAQPTLIEGAASGELEGIGRWTLTEQGGRTHVHYLWQVRTTRWWMNLLAPIARPFFAWNHDAVMRNGERSLAKRLEK